MEAQAGEADPGAKVGEVGCGVVCAKGTGEVHGMDHCRPDQRGEEEPGQEGHVLRLHQLARQLVGELIGEGSHICLGYTHACMVHSLLGSSCSGV